MMYPFITFQDVSIRYRGNAQDACHKVSLSIGKGERIGIVGESGCGKSTLLKSAIGLLGDDAQWYEGNIEYKQHSLRSLHARQMRKIRTHQIATVFQDCMNALHPAKRIGQQLMELICHVHQVSKPEAKQRAQDILYSIGFPDAIKIMRMFPYQLSGGMLQKISLAMVFLVQPQMIFADEPTSALDVVSAQYILSMLHQYVIDHDITLLLTSHQLKVVAAVCQRVIVMYQGHIVEEGAASDVLAAPLHPYTRRLVWSATYSDQTACCQDIGLMTQPENIHESSCIYAHLCPVRLAKCFHTQPPMVLLETDRRVACFHVA